jgi:DNA (cytosine-5)-methyltransferase 1
MTATITDLFCGAGGSSLGAEMAGGSLRLGLNHWDRAIETHSTNFQDADHDCTDVSSLTTAQIRRYPDSDILLASPECTNHSLAKGSRRRRPQAASLFDDGPAGDAEQDRSRATMWDVVRFTEQKLLKGWPYKAIIVENVVDAAKWGYNDDGGLFRAWLLAMEALGYEHETSWLNSMFCPPTPQSRDRMYVVFWQRGMRAPNLRVEPVSWCPTCERIVAGRQTWKRPERPWGRYGAQYLYRCPTCLGVVLPGAFPAASAIDWDLPAQRIGDRLRPLAIATRERIRRGLERLSREPFAIRLLQGGVPRPLTLPLVTLTRRHDMGVVLPVAGNTFERTPGNRARRAEFQPADTVHGTLDRALVIPPMGGVEPRDADTLPAPTQTTTTRAAVVQTSRSYDGHRANRVRSAAEPMATLAGENDRALVIGPGSMEPRVADREPSLPASAGLGVVHLRQHQTVTPLEEPVGTVSAGGGHHGVVLSNRANNVPRIADEEPTHPVLTGEHLGVVVAHYNPGWARRADDEPFGSITTRDHHSLVVPYRRGSGKPVDQCAPTVTSKDCLALVVPAGGTWRDNATPAREPSPTQTSRESFGVAWGDEEIDDCRFRIFALHEIANTMVMARHVDGGEYVVLGNKRERMAQFGNAVMQLLVERVLEVL